MKTNQSSEKTNQQSLHRVSNLASDRSFQHLPNAILQLQRTLGNQRVARLIQARRLTPQGMIIGLQSKLTVGPTNDQYEQEADSVAHQVMTMPAIGSHSIQHASVSEETSEEKTAEDKHKVLQTQRLTASTTRLVQRQMEEEELEGRELPLRANISAMGASVQPQTGPEEEEQAEVAQASAAGSLPDSSEVGAEVKSHLNLSKGSGNPLPDAVRTFMEPRFGMDFGQVRAHTGSGATRMNRDVGAKAFTHGSDIYYGAGQNPHDLELTAHELAHVVQQTGSVPLQKGRMNGFFSASADSSLHRACAACDEGKRNEDKLRLKKAGPSVARKGIGDQPTSCGPGTADPFCLGFPPASLDAPCQPFPSFEQALSVWADLSVRVPNIAAAVTICSEVKPVWDAYFAATSAPFAFSSSSSCVVRGAQTDKEGRATADSTADALLQEIIDNLPETLRRVNPSTLPAELRLTLDEAVRPHGPFFLRVDITYNNPFNAAANLAGGMGIGGQGSDVFGDDDRIMGGAVVIEVDTIDPTSGMMGGQVRWLPRVHVKDTVDFCPGNLGNSGQRELTIPMSKLEKMGLTKDVPITIDYDLALQQANFNVIPRIGPLPLPKKDPSLPVNPVLPQCDSQFRSRRFSCQLTLEACGRGEHRMLRGERDFEAVKKVQETLVEGGITVEIDGVFGGETEQAISKFKKEHSPQIVPTDGVAGPKTSHALDEVAIKREVS